MVGRIAAMEAAQDGGHASVAFIFNRVGCFIVYRGVNVIPRTAEAWSAESQQTR